MCTPPAPTTVAAHAAGKPKAGETDESTEPR